MSGMETSTAAILLITIVFLSIGLAAFSSVYGDISSKQSGILGKDEFLQTLDRTIMISGNPSASLDSCSRTGNEFSYKLSVSGLEVFFHGSPENKNQVMNVFATLSFKKKVSRDSEKKSVVLSKDAVQPFGSLAFEMASSYGPFALMPDASAYFSPQKGLMPGQSVVVRNYKATPFRQLAPLTGYFSDCYTSVLVECKSGSERVSLTACKSDPAMCKRSVILCGGRVDMSLLEYKPGTCGSMPMDFVVQAEKQAEGWEYGDYAVINFWRGDAPESKENCWQEKSYLTENCKGVFLGSYLLNLTKSNYNTGSCV